MVSFQARYHLKHVLRGFGKPVHKPCTFDMQNEDSGQHGWRGGQKFQGEP